MAKVLDMLGNEIREGSALCWTRLGAIVSVLGIKVESSNGKHGMGEIAIAVRIPFDPGKPFLHEFVAVVNPLDQAKAEGLIEMPSRGKVI